MNSTYPSSNYRRSPVEIIQLNFDSSKSWGPFYKSESPEVRIKFALRAILACKNSPKNNNMSSKWQRNETSSQPMCSSNQVFELSVLDLSRFYCTTFVHCWKIFRNQSIKKIIEIQKSKTLFVQYTNSPKNVSAKIPVQGAGQTGTVLVLSKMKK